MDWFESHMAVSISYRNRSSAEGGVVDAHIDEGAYYADKDRFHLVLSGYYENVVAMAANESTFIEDEELYSAGDLWWFDNKQMHHVENKSKLPRVAIIFDVLGSYFREKNIKKN